MTTHHPEPRAPVRQLIAASALLVHLRWTPTDIPRRLSETDAGPIFRVARYLSTRLFSFADEEANATTFH